MAALLVALTAGCGGGAGDDQGGDRAADAPPAPHAPPVGAVPAGFVRQAGGIGVFVRATIAGRPYWLKIDSGASQVVLDAALARRLRLPARGPSVGARSLACTTPARPVALRHWRIGSRAAPDVTATAQRTDFAGRRYRGTPIAGLLGADALARLGVLRIDFARHTVAFGRDSAARGGRRVPLRVARRGHGVAATARVRIGDEDLGYLLDTGAARTTIDTAAARRAALPAAGPRRGVSAVTCSAAVRPVRIARWSLEGVRLPATVALSSPGGLTTVTGQRVAGLLGADVLTRFHRVTVDFARHELVLGR